MKKLSKVANTFHPFASIPDYPKCKKCGNADPYLDDYGLCYKCFDSNAFKNPTLPSPSYNPEDTSIDQISKKDLAMVSSSNDLNKIGGPKQATTAFNNMFPVGAIDFLKQIK